MGIQPLRRTPSTQALPVVNGTVTGRTVSVPATGALAAAERRGARHVVSRKLPRVPQFADVVQRI